MHAELIMHNRNVKEGMRNMKMTHVTIQTAEFEREIEFYKKYAGMAILGDLRPNGKNIVFLGEQEGDTQIEIIENLQTVPRSTGDAPARNCALGNAAANNAEAGGLIFSIGLHTENLEELHTEMTADGLEPTPFISPMPQVKFFFVKDPAGVNVQFM